MLSRAAVRGLAADARSLSLRRLTLAFREATPLTPIAPLFARLSISQTAVKPLSVSYSRSYATAQPARSKTGTRATRKTTTAKTKTKAKPKPKSKAKPKKKAAAKKKKPVRKPKKPLTELEQLRAKVRELRQKALLQSPKQLPQTAYLIYVTENSAKGTNATAQARQHSAAFRGLSASEQEHLQNVADQNRRANERTMKNWIESFTPDQIRMANNARRQLNGIAKAPKPAGAKQALVSHKYNLLSDTRKPVRYDTAYIAFSRERWSSGDYDGVPVAEAGKRIGQEWKALSRDQAQRFHDTAAAEKSKYEQQVNRLFSTYGVNKS